MTKIEIVREEMQRLALGGIMLGGPSVDILVLDEAVPVPLAQRLCSSLRHRDVVATWEVDADDSELATVYVEMA